MTAPKVGFGTLHCIMRGPSSPASGHMPGRAVDKMTNPKEITMDTLLLPFSPRYIILTICAAR